MQILIFASHTLQRYISTLSPHFSFVKNIRRNIYKLIDNYKKFRLLFSALRFINMNKLLEISNDLKNKAKNLTDISLDEEKIFSRNYEAFKIMKKQLFNLLRLSYIL